jgi:hypothetical protein
VGSKENISGAKICAEFIEFLVLRIGQDECNDCTVENKKGGLLNLWVVGQR